MGDGERPGRRRAATGGVTRSGEAVAASGGDSGAMPTSRRLAGALALATIVLAVVGEALVLAHAGGALGLVLLAAAAPAGVAGWILLGRPTRRCDFPRDVTSA